MTWTALASGTTTTATAPAQPAGSLPAQDETPGHLEQVAVDIAAPTAAAPAQPANSVAAAPAPPPKPWERAAQASGTNTAETAPVQPAGSLPAQDQPPGHFEQAAVDIAAPAVAAPAQPAKSVTAAATPPDPLEQAVRFLAHPTMQQAPLSTKRNFIAKKGLTPAQVDEALRRAGLQTVPSDAAVVVAPVAAVESSRLSWWVAPAAAAAAVAAGVALARLLLSGLEPEANAAQPADKAGAAARDREEAAAAQDPGQTPPRRTDSAAKAHTPQFEASLGVLRGLAARARSSQALTSRAPAFGAALRAACSEFGSSVNTTGSLAVTSAAVNATGSAAVNTTGGELDTGGRASSDLVHALHTLVVVVNSMLLHPDNPRFHRIASSNANMRRLIQVMYICLSVCVYACMYVYIHRYIYVCVCVYVYIYICIYIYIYVCIYIYIYIYIYIFIYIYIYIYI